MEYIKNNGNLRNYHSFNYTYLNDEIKLNQDIIIPYMEYESKELNSICKFSNLPQLEVG
jgi:hypothetical protein